MTADRAADSFAKSLSVMMEADDDVLTWDTLGVPERGPSHQPWRAYWPPKNVETLSEDELKSKPWLTWKRDKTRPNDKPWYAWVNNFEGEVDKPCLRPPRKPHYCQGADCVRSVPILISFNCWHDINYIRYSRKCVIVITVVVKDAYVCILDRLKKSS